ncbi:MAG: pyridoxamine 5'-phosphate oxidase family protein [Gammaproteobacteria bacterium]|nr:pyridoxamine 5'-phosphate oxidase family protein [Gammaproteobacteria bacterium]
MNRSEPLPQNATAMRNALLAECRTLQLASCDADGQPHASYAPFVWVDDSFHVFLSRLAAHTEHLRQHRRAGVLLIRYEQSCPNHFARPRLSAHCAVEVMDRAQDNEHLENVLNLLQQRCGDTVAVLRTLPDFELMRLQPTHGTLVLGFGQAWELDASLQVRMHLQGR